MQSTLARFAALADRPREDSERHYTQVHVPLAIELLGSVPTIIQYSTYLVARQYDAVGRWNKRPTAWRFASQMIMTADEVEEGAAATAFPEDVRWRLAQDHRNCLRHLRRFDVEEQVLRASAAPTLSTQRYFFEFEARPDAEGEGLVEAFEDACAAIAERAEGVPGLRQVIRRGVLSEAEAGPLDDDGQLLTGQALAGTGMVGYLEVVLDSRYAAEPFFEGRDIRAILASTPTMTVEGYEVSEVVGFDKRG